jgi:ribonucleotide reductase alpha subunit
MALKRRIELASEEAATKYIEARKRAKLHHRRAAKGALTVVYPSIGEHTMYDLSLIKLIKWIGTHGMDVY